MTLKIILKYLRTNIKQNNIMIFLDKSLNVATLTNIYSYPQLKKKNQYNFNCKIILKNKIIINKLV